MNERSGNENNAKLGGETNRFRRQSTTVACKSKKGRKNNTQNKKAEESKVLEDMVDL